MSGRPVAELVTLFKNGGSREEVAKAADELVALGPEAVRPLLEFMAVAKAPERVLVLFAKMGAKAPPSLVAALDDAAVRRPAANALAMAAGGSSAPQAGALLDCMAKYPDVKLYCGIALVRGMSPKQGVWVPRLAAALKSGDRDIRLHAALALKMIGLKVPGVRAALQTAVEDEDDEVRQVVRSLGLKPLPKPAPKAGGKR